MKTALAQEEEKDCCCGSPETCDCTVETCADDAKICCCMTEPTCC